MTVGNVTYKQATSPNTNITGDKLASPWATCSYRCLQAPGPVGQEISTSIDAAVVWPS